MQITQRPWATFILSALALLAALFLEWEMGRAPQMAGFSLAMAIPLLALGFGIDWLRITRPSRSRAALVVGLALTAVALPFALVFPLSRILIVVVGLGFVAAAAGSHVWARLGHIIEATYVGQRGQRSVFVDTHSCWALYCDKSFSLRPGDLVAFRFRGDERQQTYNGPFRTRHQLSGTVVEIAESRIALRRERKRRAAWVSKTVMVAAGAAVIELAALALFVVS
ncbi:MAG: hypothetical protein ACI9KE_001131 [Polyangiales bacterium]|jgi:hypothetical protein